MRNSKPESRSSHDPAPSLSSDCRCEETDQANFQNDVLNRARNESRILRVLLVSVPSCNRSLINHNRRVWQIKRIRSRRIIFHGDHQI